MSTTEMGTPYVTFSTGILGVDGDIPFEENKQKLWNDFMQLLVNEIVTNQDKNLIWRLFPVMKVMGPDKDNRFDYIIWSRFCFEGEK